MIVTNKIQDSKFKLTQPWFRRLIWLGVAVGVVNLIYPLFILSDLDKKGKIVCTAENRTGNFFVSDGSKFNNGNTQSDEKAFEGKFSSRVVKNVYGMSYKIENPEYGVFYKASVWRFVDTDEGPEDKPGALVAQSADGKTILGTASARKREQLGWELLELTFSMPKDFSINAVNVFVYTAFDTVYFDNLKIEKLGADPDKVLDLENATEQQLNIKIADKWMQRINDKREEALKVGLLVASEDDWVKGEIHNGDTITKVELRLKGDWLDHLLTEQWSMRFKVKSGKAWNRLITFSIQAPTTRGLLREWVYHKFLEENGVITPRYDFIPVFINGISKGVYAYEEHFDKQLVEFKDRREGPIVKFAEDPLWLNVFRKHTEFADTDIWENNFLSPEDAAAVEPFKESRTLGSPSLAKQFGEAKILMNQYRYNERPVEEIFDLDLMAKYYATIDLLQAYHGVVWHNQRFYYNPVTSKLEPIGYDGYAQGEWKNWGVKKFIGQRIYNPRSNDEGIQIPLFRSEAFMEKYVAYLYKFAGTNYLSDFIERHESAIDQRVKLIRRDHYDLRYDTKPVFERALELKAHLIPFEDQSVKAFTAETTNKDTKTIQITNHHGLPLKVVGFGTNRKTITEKAELPLLITNLKGYPAEYKSTQVKPAMKYVFFQLPGMDSLFTSEISKWKPSVPGQFTTEQELFASVDLKNNPIYLVEGEAIIFKPGTHTMDKDFIVPRGYQIRIPAGTTLDFVKKAKFISKSPVFMYGTADNPIKIKSSDKSGNGFTVMKTKSRSELSHVTFENMNTLDYKNWTLTGAVTFYESEVKIRKCSFIKNHCEDALNIVRSGFDINGIVISETFGDGLDIDFGKGTIRNALFNKTGNDGIDFSGSKITIENIIINDAGDKAVSIGEQSTVHIKRCEINTANIAVASKDLSKLTIDSIDLNNCKQGFTAYQKKPEFGGGSIDVKAYTAKDIRYLHQIEKGSTLLLSGKKTGGI